MLAPKDVEDCFYIALEAARIARKYSTPGHHPERPGALASRIEAFDRAGFRCVEHELASIRNVPPDFKPYPLDRQTRNTPLPARRCCGGKYPVISGLEHDEWGHPSSSPVQHAKMNAKRRTTSSRCSPTNCPLSPIHGAEEGEVLLGRLGIDLGADPRGRQPRPRPAAASPCIHMRHLHPMPKRPRRRFEGFNHVLVVEMNDEGLYGYGQLATLLRARYANPRIRSITKTDGLAFRIREIIAGIEERRDPVAV